MELALVAGAVSTTLFAGANLPMLAKALRTHDLASYSLSHLLIGNAGNLVHTVYVVSLPMGPIWILHGFYVVSMGIMLVLCLRARGRSTTAAVRGRTLDHGRTGGARRGRTPLRRVR